MKISVEQTPKQELPDYVLEHIDSVSVVHLPGRRLTDTIHTITSIKRKNKKVKIIPHIAARSLKNKNELFTNCDKFVDLGIEDILLIGGSTKTGSCYADAFNVYDDIKNKDYKFNTICGVYPQHETNLEIENKKYKKFSRGITQICLNHRLLTQFDNKTIIGVPSKCSANDLLKFIKICGVGRSIKEAIPNIAGVKYLSVTGFNTAKFVRDLSGNPDIHIFNFGNIENTIRSLQKLL